MKNKCYIHVRWECFVRLSQTVFCSSLWSLYYLFSSFWYYALCTLTWSPRCFQRFFKVKTVFIIILTCYMLFLLILSQLDFSGGSVFGDTTQIEYRSRWNIEYRSRWNFFLKNFFVLYWSIADLQSYVSFRCPAKWFSYICTYIDSFWDSFHI